MTTERSGWWGIETCACPGYPGGQQAFQGVCTLLLPDTVAAAAGARDCIAAARRSRRIWKPNVVCKRLYSEALGQEVQLKLTTTALR
jgi:hypothetical protein